MTDEKASLANVNVRLAAGEDSALLAGYLRALAEEERSVELAEGEADESIAPPDDLVQRLEQHGPAGDSYFQAVIVEVDGSPKGMAMFSLAYDGLLAAPCVFMRHIFVEKEARRNKLGTAMMVALARLCLNQGWPRIDWQVRRLDFNARPFFDGLCADGFKLHRLCYRADGQALASIANLPV